MGIKGPLDFVTFDIGSSRSRPSCATIKYGIIKSLTSLLNIEDVRVYIILMNVPPILSWTVYSREIPVNVRVTAPQEGKKKILHTWKEIGYPVHNTVCRGFVREKTYTRNTTHYTLTGNNNEEPSFNEIQTYL